MYSLFRGTNFNGNISNWDVNKVTNMSHMFDGTKAFNQDISNWNIGHKV
jgi:surface protein